MAAPTAGSPAPPSKIATLTALFPKKDGKPTYITEPQEFNETMERLASSGLCNLLCSIQYVDYIPPVQAVSLRVIVAREEMYYQPKNWGQGFAPTGNAVATLFREAGGQYRKSERIDDRSDPLYCHMTATVVIRGMNGLDAEFSKDRELDLRPGSPEAKGMTDKQLAQAQQNILRVCETKAQLRAMRVALGMSQSYTGAGAALPFVIPTLVPNPDMSDPRQADFMLAHSMGAVEMLYGKKQIAAPATVTTPEGTIDAHTGEIIDAEIANEAAGANTAANTASDLGDLSQPEAQPEAQPHSQQCDCPCGCKLPVSEQRAAITIQRRGTVRCAACYPGKDFDPEKHKSLASLGMNPDVTVKQAIAMKAGTAAGER